MKKDIHPEYREIVFEDTSTGKKFLTRSTFKTKERTQYEGKEFPVCRVPISASSHPFFTGSSHFVDSEGRVDKFLKRYKRTQKEEKKS